MLGGRWNRSGIEPARVFICRMEDAVRSYEGG